jgi:hypothetical protein
MSYRGSDLNLQDRSSRGPADTTQAGANGAHKPSLPEAAAIDADATLLACCTHAYDAAVLHGAPEVRLGHLLHALTRIPAAAEALEQRGIRADHLRRETAMAMAAEEPRLPPEAPQTSHELADVLRRAAARAYARQAPASVDDVLRAVVAGDRDAAAGALLMRAAADPERLERWREELRLHPEPPAPPPRSAQAGLGEAVLQRLHALEGSLRSLVADAAAERNALRDLMQELRRELHAPRPEGSALMGDQAGRIEATLEARAADLGKALAALGERFTAIDKLAADDWAQLNARMESLQASMAASGADIGSALSTKLAERLDRLEAGLQGGESTMMPGWDTVSGQLVSLEAAVRAHLESAEAAARAHERELSEVYEALVKLGANQQTLGNNLNTWRLESSGDVSIISNKLEQLEQTTLGVLTRINAEFQSLREEEAESITGTGAFKRWLHGTTSAMAANWRQEAKSIRDLVRKPGTDKKS